MAGSQTSEPVPGAAQVIDGRVSPGPAALSPGPAAWLAPPVCACSQIAQRFEGVYLVQPTRALGSHRRMCR